MTGITWHILTFSVLGIFLVLMVGRLVSMARRPEHLRWELAPVPRDKGKTGYGGSYLEDYEWWRKPRQKSLAAPVIYMLREIFTLKSVRENNKWLWPFSMSLHYGIYLIILALAVYFVSALLLINGASKPVMDVFYTIITVVVAAACIIGGIGAVGLILKRGLDAGLRTYSSFASFFKLALLLAVFVSAAVAMLAADNYAADMTLFVKGILTLDKTISVSVISSIHLFISLLFVLVLPLTSMVHFVTKHFTYYAVRWNDEPLDARMSGKLAKLASKPTNWAAHRGGEGKSWTSLAGDDDEKS